MSHVEPTVVICPSCGAHCRARLFDSLNADRIPAQVAAILDGSFERMACERCGVAFQPEHNMLYAHASARLWIVMYPVAARGDFPRLEREVAARMARNFDEAPGVLADHLRGLRPRLVFGHYALAEAVRAQRDAIDAALLEASKLLAYRENLASLVGFGPSELVYEGDAPDARLAFTVRRFPTGEPIGAVTLPARVLGEARGLLPVLATSHPELFDRAYISAARYLS